MVVAAFAAMSLSGYLSPHAQLWLLGVGAVGFDLGVQASLIAHQTIIYSLEPAARSRLNAVLITSMFIGMAAGSALGSVLLAQFGWIGVTLLAMVAGMAAWWVRVAKR